MKDKTLMYGLYGIFALSFLSLLLATYRHLNGEDAMDEGFVEAFLFAALNIGIAVFLAIVIKLYYNQKK